MFISSTYEDLIVERQAVLGVALENSIIPVGMEQFHSAPASQWDVITKMIDECDGYMLIVAGKYGSIDATEGISYTEKEYNYAKSKNMPIWVLIREKSAITADKMDKPDPKYPKQEMLEKFIAKVMNDGNTVDFFKSTDDLKYRVGQALSKASEYFSEDSGWVRYSEIEKENAQELFSKKGEPCKINIDNFFQNAELALVGDSLDSYGKCDSRIGKLFLSIPEYLKEKGMEFSKEGNEKSDEHSYLVTKGLKFSYCKSVRVINNHKIEKIVTALKVSVAALGFKDSLSLLFELLRLNNITEKNRIDIHLKSYFDYIHSTEEASAIICSNEDFSLDGSKVDSYIYTKQALRFSVEEDKSHKRALGLPGCVVSVEFDNDKVTSEGIIELINRLVEIGFINDNGL